MITFYKLLVFGHILFAMIWFGALVVLEVLALAARKNHKKEDWLKYLDIISILGSKIFPIAGSGTLIFGILAVIFGRPEFKQYWVILGLVGVVITGFLGGRILGPSSEKLLKLFKNRDLKDKEVQSLIKKVELVSYLDLVLMLIIIFDMIMKPTDILSLFTGVSGVFLLLSTGFYFYSSRK